MYSPRVKICGIKTLEIALYAAENGADSLGFVFFDKSPRAVCAAAVRGITSNLPPFINKTGVFVDKNIDEILDIAFASGIDTIQLHSGSAIYNREFIENLSRRCSFPVIMAMGMEFIDENSVAALMNDPQPGISAWMIDNSGGTGRPAIWHEISDKRTAAFLRSRVIIAGGINISNVGYLLEKMLPYGIDVSSGLEIERGVKDKGLIKKFMGHVREISEVYLDSENGALY
ncbi:MAG: phosphoribosylanthranilate isomerase [Brevinematales bacterium]